MSAATGEVTRVEQLQGFPFGDFSEFRRAYLDGIVGPRVDRTVALRWAQGGIYASRFLRTQVLVIAYLPFLAIVGFVAYDIASKDWLLLLALPVLLIGFFLLNPGAAAFRGRLGSIRQGLILLSIVGAVWGLLTWHTSMLAFTVALLTIWGGQEMIYRVAASALIATMAAHEDLLCALWQANALRLKVHERRSIPDIATKSGTQQSPGVLGPRVRTLLFDDKVVRDLETGESKTPSSTSRETASSSTAGVEHIAAVKRDPGIDVLRQVFSDLAVENEWSVREERAFRWWPHRAGQRIWAEPPHRNANIELCRIHVETDLLRNVPGTEKSARVLAALNTMASLNAWVWDQHNGQIKLHCSVSVSAGGEQWFSRFLTIAAALQADTSLKAEELGEVVKAEVDASPHPVTGQRSAPAPVLRALLSALTEEQQAESRVTETDLQNFLGMEPRPWTRATRHGMEVRADFPFFDDVGPATLIVAPNATHPALGRGALLRLALPNVMDPQTAVEVANLLNEAEVSNWEDFQDSTRGEPPQFLGAWCENHNMVSHVTFVPAILVRPDTLGVMAYSTGQRVHFVRNFMLQYPITMASSEALSLISETERGKRGMPDVLQDWLKKLGFQNAPDIVKRILGQEAGHDASGIPVKVEGRTEREKETTPDQPVVIYEVRCQQCGFHERVDTERAMWETAQEHARQMRGQVVIISGGLRRLGHVLIASGRGASLVTYRDESFGGYEVQPGDHLSEYLRSLGAPR